MDNYCDVRDKFIKPKSKTKHFKPNTHKEFNICKHMEITIEKPDINKVYEVFYAYIIQINKQYDQYSIECHVKLVFNDNQYSTYVKSNLFSNKTMISWKKYLENVIDDFGKKGYKFNTIEKLKIITKSNKMDMSYDFHIKHNMDAVEWKIIAMINKNKNLTNNFPRICRHLLNRKIESYRFPI